MEIPADRRSPFVPVLTLAPSCSWASSAGVWWSPQWLLSQMSLNDGKKKKCVSSSIWAKKNTVFLFKTYFVTDTGVAFMPVRQTPRRPKCIFDKGVYVAISKKNWSSKPRCHYLPQQLQVGLFSSEMGFRYIDIGLIFFHWASNKALTRHLNSAPVSNLLCIRMCGQKTQRVSNTCERKTTLEVSGSLLSVVLCHL